MNWKDYEKEIYEHFVRIYPNAQISYNVKIVGKYSKTNRQIDILIEEYIAGNKIKIIVDGKFFKKKIDVKIVEMFISMLKDCSVSKGILITQEGFTKAAINRAYYGEEDIELDILNFKDLKMFQGFGAIPYTGTYAVFLPAPFGWILDGTRRIGMLATLYQRGFTLEDAAKNKEWMYVNIRVKDEQIKNLDDLLKYQRKYTLEANPNAKISMLPTIKRNDANVKIRIIEDETYPTKEYTGFVEFEKFIFFAVLFTPEELKNKNIKKLESILQQVKPIFIKHQDI